MTNGWTPSSPCAPPTVYLPLSGGTMTGPITLVADPVQPLGAVTKQYVDTTVGNLARIGDNRIINGNFAINQRTYITNTALVAAAYGHDRWKAGTAGCTYTFTATLPDTTIMITAGTLTQIIEAGMIEGGVYTLSWVGAAQARIYQGAPTGSYVASPLVTASLPAGVNTIIEFNAGTVTRVKLEIGSVATLFNRQSLAKSLADCQRYFERSYDDGIATGAATANGSVGAYLTGITASTHGIGASFSFKTSKRAAPTITLYSTVTGATGMFRDLNATADTTVNTTKIGASSFFWACTASSNSSFNVEGHWTANAEL